MGKKNEIILAIWSEVCKHIEIGESTQNIQGILARHLPLNKLVVQQIDLDNRIINSLAVSYNIENTKNHGNTLTAYSSHTKLTSQTLGRLITWCREGRMGTYRDKTKQPPIIKLAMPNSVKNESLLIPLMSEHDITGVLILEAVAGKHFSRIHQEVASMLAEPFAAAIKNDRRLHELKTLQESAEADRQSLLMRLGREQLLDEVIGANSGLKPVMDRLTLVSKSDMPILILGETGSGKEVIARLTHNKSSRATGPFIRVNCGAIPPDLIDSELFGHEKGAFTGALSTRRGWFERADAGTLFLDEIGDLPLPAQVRLLRILQDGTFERVGGEQMIKVDVRIIAATHRDLPIMVQESRFREDLWYRIAVFPIVLPPLRERIFDIPALADHFARRAARRFGTPVVLPNKSDVALLSQYDWPGNIRELASVLDRAVILGNGAQLEIDKALGVAPAKRSLRNNNLQTTDATTSQINHDLHTLSLDEVMRSHIEHILEMSNGIIEGPRGAAVKLNINPHTLRARMKKLKIKWAKYRNYSSG